MAGAASVPPGQLLVVVALAFVKGLTTFIVPVQFSVMEVGPVNKQPSPPRLLSASALIVTLFGGIVRGRRTWGRRVANDGLLEHERWRATGCRGGLPTGRTLP